MPNGTLRSDGSHLDLPFDCWAGRINYRIDLSKEHWPCCLLHHRCRRSVRASWLTFVLDSSLLVFQGSRTLAFVGLAVVQSRKSVFSLEVVAGNCSWEQYLCRHSIHFQVLSLCSLLRILESQAPQVILVIITSDSGPHTSLSLSDMNLNDEEAVFLLLLFLSPIAIWPPWPGQ